MTDRSTLVWELLKVKDGLDLSCLSNEQFNVLDVCSRQLVMHVLTFYVGLPLLL